MQEIDKSYKGTFETKFLRSRFSQLQDRNGWSPEQMSEVQQSLAEMNWQARTGPDVQWEKEIFTYGNEHLSDIAEKSSTFLLGGLGWK